MRKFKLICEAVGLAIVITGATALLPVQTKPQPASAAVASDKYDGDCSPTATVGRCADKCPAPTAEGAYNQLGTDPTTGAAICHFVFANACPYSEAVSADDPLCYKNQPQQPAVTTPVTPAPVPTNQCGGK